jgi:hypothetical protein
MTAPAAESSRRWLWAALLVTAAKLWLTRGQAVHALGHAGHDDRLFLELAGHLLRGDWLGPYDQLTLAKGPMYSIWIALVALLHLPLYFAQHLLYAASCALLVRACAPALPSSAARFAGYLLLLWNPMSYDASSLGRVLRQHIYSPEVLLIFAGLIALHYRRDLPLRRLAPWAGLLGLAGGAFYLTREEAVWLAPSVALLGGAAVWLAWRASRAALVSLLKAFTLAAVCAALPVFIVAALNHHYYGWFGTVEFRSPEMQRAYGALVRVQAGPAVPFVPLTREARAAIYRVSPAFAELQPHLDGDIGLGWAGASSGVTGRPAADREIGGGWLVWAVRDSVAAAGHARSAGDAIAYYRRLAQEVNAACDDGRLPAGPPRSGFLPPGREGQLGAIAQTFFEFMDFTTSFSRFSAFAPASDGDEASLQLFRDLTHERLSGDHATALDHHRTNILHRVGKALRPLLLLLVIGAQLVAAARLVQLLVQRTWSFPLTVAAAAWGGAFIYLLLTAVLQVTSYPILAISSLAPVYPLLLVFIAATAWDAGAAWLPSRVTGGAPEIPVRPAPMPAPGKIELTGAVRLLPWLAGVTALAPFVIWRAQFAELFWFADDYFLIDQMASFGFWPWVRMVFAENYVPVFKLLWGGAVLQFNGSYSAMLWLMWLTHALNTLLFGRLLLRSGLPWFATAVTLVLFALPAANLETLGWSVQWSAVLAATFLLLGLLWHERAAHRSDLGAFRRYAPLVAAAALSACCFSRGVLTGAVLALATLLPALLARERSGWGRRIGFAGLCFAPSVAVALLIVHFSSGNHQQMAGHVGQALQYGLGFFLLNPAFLLLELGWVTGSLWLAGGLKVAVVAGGLWLASPRLRLLLLLLLAYDLGNAVLLGVGRYHTGITTVISSRYYYSSLIATLPFAALLLGEAVDRLVARPRGRQFAAAVLLTALTWHCFRGWPGELTGFVRERGTDLRRTMAAPAVAGSKETVPALNFMHVERGKALIRAYHLH